MVKKMIVVGDTTTHGGTVISGSPTQQIEGKPVARLGDLVNCPLVYPGGRPHGVNKIIEGESGCTVDGIPVALEGHKTECGCALIGSVSSSIG